jgi:hypothetical protein
MVNFFLTPSALNGVPSIRRLVFGGLGDALKNSCDCDRCHRRSSKPGRLRLGAAALALRTALVRQGDRADITQVPPGLRMNTVDYPPPRQRFYRATPLPPLDDQPPDEQ